ncbi:MAG: FixH family protein [Candidatus Aminicenantes bacterium]|nr:FixH family protein [Candidatus Aminicenantes bacterium]
MRTGRAAFISLLTLLAVLTGFAGTRESRQCCSPGLTPSGPQTQEPVFQDLAKSGKKCWIGEVNYFTWEFDKTPKMGTSILIIKLYDRDGKRITDLQIVGQSDMPSMRGAHDSGEVAFKKNKAGDYLLPVNVVMPGDWEVRLTFSRNGIVIFRGRIAFDV